MNAQRFKHDRCPYCRFTGQYGAEDIWYCGGPSGPTIMRRASDEPYDYRSMSPMMARTLNAGDFRNASEGLDLFIKEWRDVVKLVDAAILEAKGEEIQ